MCFFFCFCFHFPCFAYTEVYAREFHCNNVYTGSGSILFCKRCRRVLGYVDYIDGERVFRLIDVRLMNFEFIKKNVEGEKEVIFLGASEHTSKRKRVESEVDSLIEPPQKKRKVNELLVMHVRPQYESLYDLLEEQEGDADDVFITGEYIDLSQSDHGSEVDQDTSLYNDDWSSDSSQSAIGLEPYTPDMSPLVSMSSSFSELFMHENFNVLENAVGGCKLFCLHFCTDHNFPKKKKTMHENSYFSHFLICTFNFFFFFRFFANFLL